MQTWTHTNAQHMTAFILFISKIPKAINTCKSLGHKRGAHVILRFHNNVSNSAACVLQGSGGGWQLLVWECQSLQAQQPESETLITKGKMRDHATAHHRKPQQKSSLQNPEQQSCRDAV